MPLIQVKIDDAVVSELAVPMIANGELVGVLISNAAERMHSRPRAYGQSGMRQRVLLLCTSPGETGAQTGLWEIVPPKLSKEGNKPARL